MKLKPTRLRRLLKLGAVLWVLGAFIAFQLWTYSPGPVVLKLDSRGAPHFLGLRLTSTNAQAFVYAAISGFDGKATFSVPESGTRGENMGGHGPIIESAQAKLKTAGIIEPRPTLEVHADPD